MKRLLSLDAFRGITIASMILVNDPGSWDAAYPQLRHSRWNGITFTDLVFPFFLFIAGVALTFSLARRMEGGAQRGALLLHSARRAGLIFFLGLVLNALPFSDLAHLRIPGVLQRIAICYFVAALIFLHSGIRGTVLWTAALLTVYWLLMTLVPVPGFGPGVLTKEGNFARYIDGMVLTGHMYRSTRMWDPEGIVSTLPAIGNALFGVLAGHWLRTEKAPAEKAAWLFTSGGLLCVAGAILKIWMPVNKSLWTTPYSMLTSGLAMLLLAGFYWIIDGQGWDRWARPLIIFGRNALTMYVLSELMAMCLALFGWQDPIYGAFASIAPPKIASLLFALSFVAVCYGVAWVMYRRNLLLRF